MTGSSRAHEIFRLTTAELARKAGVPFLARAYDPKELRDQRGKWVKGPFYHGTRREIPVGAHLKSHLENRRTHFTTDPEQARLWGTDAEGTGPVKVYEVEPQGGIESGRGVGGLASRDPVKVVGVHTATTGLRPMRVQPGEFRAGDQVGGRDRQRGGPGGK